MSRGWSPHWKRVVVLGDLPSGSKRGEFTFQCANNSGDPEGAPFTLYGSVAHCRKTAQQIAFASGFPTLLFLPEGGES